MEVHTIIQRQNKLIHLKWIPAHNKLADQLANKGTATLQLFTKKNHIIQQNYIYVKNSKRK